MRRFVQGIVFLATAAQIGVAVAQDLDARHVTVYYEEGRFGGWPANRGAWIWDDEILVGFSRGYYKDLGDRHHIDREKPEDYLLARSLDGGETWEIEYPNEEGYLLAKGPALHGTQPENQKAETPVKQTEPINFQHKDFALALRMTNIDGGQSHYFYSYDRGHTWKGPFTLPNFQTPGIAARTDYIVNGKDDCMLFLTAAKDNRQEGRPLLVRTLDGGLSWKFVSFIGPEPDGYSIMPASVRISEKELFVAIRRREGDPSWIDGYRSLDNGKKWVLEHEHLVDTAIGNPPSLIKLADGRLCLTYGYRGEPWSIRAVLSSDNGKSWTPPITLRDDGCSQDIGYVRSLQRPDGKVVTMYYFCDAEHGPERYIAATIWNP
jgi:hypothetical protein